jgi:hypothetical protein
VLRRGHSLGITFHLDRVNVRGQAGLWSIMILTDGGRFISFVRMVSRPLPFFNSLPIAFSSEFSRGRALLLIAYILCIHKSDSRIPVWDYVKANASYESLFTNAAFTAGKSPSISPRLYRKLLAPRCRHDYCEFQFIIVRKLCALICRVFPDSPQDTGIPVHEAVLDARVLNNSEPPSSSQPEQEQNSSLLPSLCRTVVPSPPPPRHPIFNSSSIMP